MALHNHLLALQYSIKYKNFDDTRARLDTVSEAELLAVEGPSGSLLHRVVRHRAPEDIVARLAAVPVLVNSRDERGNTPLHLAVAFHQDVVPRLVAYGADADLMNAAGETPLHRAAVDGFPHDSLPGFEDLITEDNVNIVHEEVTPLMAAIAGGHTMIVRILLRGGADPAVVTRAGSALHAACARDFPQDLLNQLLVEELALINSTDADVTPLYYALGLRRFQVAFFLLRHGAAVTPPPPPQTVNPERDLYNIINHRDRRGRTAIYAALEQSPSMVRPLVDLGADVTVQCHANKTPLHVACATPGMPLGVAQAVWAPELAMVRDGEGLLPAELAAAAGNWDLVYWLVWGRGGCVIH